jgi:hypothetical protein
MGRKRTDRQNEALALRAAGASYQQIGDALGMNKATAYRMIQRALPAREPDERELQLDLVRLDQALMAIWPQVRSGDLAAVNTFVKLTDVRERLRARWYMRGPATVVNQETTVKQVQADGVIVIQGRTSEEYIAGLRAARGETEQPALPPPRRQLVSASVEPDLEGGVPTSPGGRTAGDVLRDGSVQQVGLSDGEVSQSSEASDVIDQ